MDMEKVLLQRLFLAALELFAGKESDTWQGVDFFELSVDDKIFRVTVSSVKQNKP